MSTSARHAWHVLTGVVTIVFFSYLLWIYSFVSRRKKKIQKRREKGHPSLLGSGKAQRRVVTTIFSSKVRRKKLEEILEISGVFSKI